MVDVIAYDRAALQPALSLPSAAPRVEPVEDDWQGMVGCCHALRPDPRAEEARPGQRHSQWLEDWRPC